MKKVFFIIPSLECGGAERVTITFAKNLNPDNFSPVLINIGYDEGALRESIPRHLPIISLRKKNISGSFIALFKILKRERPDFIFSSINDISVLLLIIGFFLRKIKIIVRIPTMPGNKLYKDIKSRIVRSLEILLFKRADKIISQTEEMKKEIFETYRVGLSRITTIINPLDIEFIHTKLKSSVNPFPNDCDQLKYLAVGNVSYAKGIDVLTEAFNHFLLNYKNAHLYIIGSCESKYAKNLILQTKIKKLGNNIHFLGFKRNPYVYMKYCDVFVLSSRMEGLPNVLLEANYLNKPIISTRCVPFVEKIIQNRVNGLIVEPDNIEKLHYALREILLIKENTIPVPVDNSKSFNEFQTILS